MHVVPSLEQGVRGGACKLFFDLAEGESISSCK